MKTLERKLGLKIIVCPICREKKNIRKMTTKGDLVDFNPNTKDKESLLYCLNCNITFKINFYVNKGGQ